MIEPISLFTTKKERLFAMAFILLVLALSLAYRYAIYSELVSKKFYHTTAYVLNQYGKGDRQILKLKTPHFLFYTSTKEDLKDLRDREVAVMLIRTRKIPTFLEFLQGFYAVSYIKGVLPKSRRYELKEAIAAQHGDAFAKELFGALFLATSLSKDLREKLSALGLAHLVALSGFHLGVIVAVVAGMLVVLFKPLWRRLWPYRNINFFATALGLIAGGAYMAFVGFVPSLVRAFVLSIVVFFLFWRHIKLLSFELLFWVVALILALEPRFFFSVGFWFSVAGVFCIYLFLHHFSHLPKWMQFLLFNLWVYALMLPVVHLVFEPFSWWQLLSPLVSLLFVFFYPVAFVLHLLGLGGSLDGSVAFLHGEFEVVRLHTPPWFGFMFLTLLIASIYKHRIIFLALLLEVGWFVHEITKL